MVCFEAHFLGFGFGLHAPLRRNLSYINFGRAVEFLNEFLEYYKIIQKKYCALNKYQKTKAEHNESELYLWLEVLGGWV